MATSQCVCCRKHFTPTRNPQQRYCSKKSCQKARKNDWRRKKRASDVDYRDAQQDSNKRWREKNPDYQANYRASHPDYEEHNRTQTRLRKQVRGSSGKTQGFVKSDALKPGSPLKTGVYQISAVDAGEDNFVKSDALMIRISLISTCYECVGAVCKETTL